MDARTYEGTPVSVDRTAESNMERAPIDLNRHIALLRRRLRLVLGVALCVFVASIIVTFLINPKYTATAEVILDTRQTNVSSVQQVLSGIPDDASAVDTEAEVLKSRSLAEKVLTKLHLDQDPEFNKAIGPQPFWSGLVPAFGEVPPQLKKEEIHNKVVDNIIKNLKVARSGLTNVIAISFASHSRERSAEVANTFANLYLVEQLDAKFDATRRASDWLNSRLGTLKTQVEQAEAAVAVYKGAHGLMGLTGSEGSTIAQQEISTINTQLAQAKAQQAEAEANLSTAQQQLSHGSTGDDLGASLNSPVVNQLRQQRAQISAQVADMEGRLGPRHPDMLKAQRQLADIDNQIQAEIRRISSNLEASAQVARQRTASIQGSLAVSRGSLAANGSASVELNNLQRNADSLSALYQTYLDRFKQTSNQQGLEQSDSRIVSVAKIPATQSFPNIPLFLALGLALAILSAVAVTFVVEALENGLYTSEDVEKLMGLPHLGSIPLLSSVLDRTQFKADVSPTRLVIDKPLSIFAESFRGLKTSITTSRVGEVVQTVAITSSLPGEGKTTTCICLGRVMALGGTSTVIVDCDLRRRTVNRLFAHEPTVGLLEVLAGSASLEDALIRDEESGAYFLPLSKTEYTPKDVFASKAMVALLNTLKDRFDIVLLDTAPVLPVADTKVLAPRADVTVFLAQWRKTPRKAIENAVKQLESVGAFVIGIGLTQVDMKEQARSGYGDAGYYYRAYKQYYTY